MASALGLEWWFLTLTVSQLLNLLQLIEAAFLIGIDFLSRSSRPQDNCGHSGPTLITPNQGWFLFTAHDHLELADVSDKSFHKLVRSLFSSDQLLTSLTIPAQSENYLPGEFSIAGTNKVVAGGEDLLLHLPGKVLPLFRVAIQRSAEGGRQQAHC